MASPLPPVQCDGADDDEDDNTERAPPTHAPRNDMSSIARLQRSMPDSDTGNHGDFALELLQRAAVHYNGSSSSMGHIVDKMRFWLEVPDRHEVSPDLIAFTLEVIGTRAPMESMRSKVRHQFIPVMLLMLVDTLSIWSQHVCMVSIAFKLLSQVMSHGMRSEYPQCATTIALMRRSGAVEALHAALELHGDNMTVRNDGRNTLSMCDALDFDCDELDSCLDLLAAELRSHQPFPMFRFVENVLDVHSVSNMLAVLKNNLRWNSMSEQQQKERWTPVLNILECIMRALPDHEDIATLACSMVRAMFVRTMSLDEDNLQTEAVQFLRVRGFNTNISFHDIMQAFWCGYDCLFPHHRDYHRVGLRYEYNQTFHDDCRFVMMLLENRALPPSNERELNFILKTIKSWDKSIQRGTNDTAAVRFAQRCMQKITESLSTELDRRVEGETTEEKKTRLSFGNKYEVWHLTMCTIDAIESSRIYFGSNLEAASQADALRDKCNYMLDMIS